MKAELPPSFVIMPSGDLQVEQKVYIPKGMFPQIALALIGEAEEIPLCSENASREEEQIMNGLRQIQQALKAKGCPK